MGQLISTCYVIENIESGVESVIYLERPETLRGEKLHMYFTVFEAAAIIRASNNESGITIVKHPVSAETRELLAQ